MEAKKMNIINMEELEEIIINVETYLEGYNEIEKELILNGLIRKRQTAKEKQKASDIISSFNLSDLSKQMSKGG